MIKGIIGTTGQVEMEEDEMLVLYQCQLLGVDDRTMAIKGSVLIFSKHILQESGNNGMLHLHLILKYFGEKQVYTYRKNDKSKWG